MVNGFEYKYSHRDTAICKSLSLLLFKQLEVWPAGTSGLFLFLGQLLLTGINVGRLMDVKGCGLSAGLQNTAA